MVKHVILITFFLALFLPSCVRQNPASPQSLETLSPVILLKTHASAAIPAGVDSIRITITSPQLDRPHMRSFVYGAHEGDLDLLPAGIPATITVEGVDDSNRVLFRGKVFVPSLSKTPVIVEIFPDQITPLSPTNLSVRKLTGNRFVLVFQDNAYNAQGFVVERAQNLLGPWDTAAVIDTNAYLDTGLTLSTTYYYRVYARNSAGPSLMCAAASCKTGATISNNNPPVFITQGFDLPDSLKAGAIFLFSLAAMDGDSGTHLTYHAVNPPPGLAIDSLLALINWRPAQPGTYHLAFVVNDDSLNADTLRWTVTVQDASPFIGFDPPFIAAAAGQSLTVSLSAGNMTGLFGVSCGIVFDTSLMTITEDSMAAGPLLGTDPIKIFKVDGDTVSIGLTRMAGQRGVTGSGVLATLKFGLKKAGNDTLTISGNGFHMIKEDGNEVDYIGQVKKGTSEIKIK
jgi:hypothetical protein